MGLLPEREPRKIEYKLMKNRISIILQYLLYSSLGAVFCFSILLLFSVGTLRDFLDLIPMGSRFVSDLIQIVFAIIILFLVSIIPVIVFNSLSFVLPILIGIFSYLLIQTFIGFNQLVGFPLVNKILFSLFISLILSFPGIIAVAILKITKSKFVLSQAGRNKLLGGVIIFSFCVMYFTLVYLYPYKDMSDLAEAKLRFPSKNITSEEVINPKFKFNGDRPLNVIDDLANYFASKFFVETSNYHRAVNWDNSSYFYWVNESGHRIILAYDDIFNGENSLEIIIPLRPEDINKSNKDNPMDIKYINNIFKGINDVFINNGFAFMSDNNGVFNSYSKENLKCGLFTPTWKKITRTYTSLNSGYNMAHIIISCSDEYDVENERQTKLYNDLEIPKETFAFIEKYNEPFVWINNKIAILKNNKWKIVTYYSDGWNSAEIQKYNIPKEMVGECCHVW